MSVIVRRNNRIMLFCKGADNVIYDRLGSDQSELKTRTQEHLNVNCVLSVVCCSVDVVKKTLKQL